SPAPRSRRRRRPRSRRPRIPSTRAEVEKTTMPEPNATRAPNLAIFCDYENVALGARDAAYREFDIGLVLERLLDKGKVVVKKAYSGWNSADIRLVVDALDLCYTKSHIDLFVIVSGDSDFSPLVNKLRENQRK